MFTGFTYVFCLYINQKSILNINKKSILNIVELHSKQVLFDTNQVYTRMLVECSVPTSADVPALRKSPGTAADVGTEHTTSIQFFDWHLDPV